MEIKVWEKIKLDKKVEMGQEKQILESTFTFLFLFEKPVELSSPLVELKIA